MINPTITDTGLVTFLEMQLKRAGYSWLDIDPVEDREIGRYKFATFRADLCDPNGVVYGAWIVCGGPVRDQNAVFPESSVYNQENYPTIERAIAQQIGWLVLDGRLKLVSHSDGKRVGKGTS